MTIVASAFGTKIVIQTSVTFPYGATFTQVGDDTDPVDIPSLQIQDGGMNINGDLVVWSKANPVKVSVSLIAGSVDDQLMSVLFQANRVGRGKKSTNDIVNISIYYPDGRISLFSNGVISDGIPGRAIANSGRLKVNTYSFMFENTAST